MTKKEIRHRRLYAFFESKVLNVLTSVIFVSLLLVAYTKTLLLPCICATLAFLLGLGYSFWLWFRKPKAIVINTFLSNISGAYGLYFLIVVAIDAVNPWWYIPVIVSSVVTLYIASSNYRDEDFHI